MSWALSHTNKKLLDITKLVCYIAKAQTEASYDVLEKWQHKDDVKALVFGSTSAIVGERTKQPYRGKN